MVGVSGVKRVIRRQLVVVTIFMAMLAVLTGCGNKKEYTKDNLAQTDPQGMTYEGTELVLDGMQGEIISFVYRRDKLYIQTREYPEQVDVEQGSDVGTGKFLGDSLYCANVDGSNLQKLPFQLSERDDLSSLMVGADGELIYLTYTSDQKTGAYRTVLVKRDADGKEVLREDITEALQIEEKDFVCRLLMDQDENVIAVTGKKVFILSRDMELLGEVNAQWGSLSGAALTKDGQVVCTGTASIHGTSDCQIHVLDVDGRKWGKTCKLKLENFSGSDCIMDGCDYDFYYKDESGIYGYDIEQDAGIKLMDYVASNLVVRQQRERTISGITMFEIESPSPVSDSVYGMVPVGDDRWIGLMEQSGSDDISGSLAMYEKADGAAGSGRQTVTYGALWVDDSIRAAAVAFNKENKDYQIEFQTYENEEDPITKMNTDIIAGKVPDILDLHEISIDSYIAKGMLENLLPYMEQDPECSVSDFMEPVIEAMKMDGSLYYIAPEFGVHTLVGRTADVGNQAGWTFEELAAVLEEKGTNVMPFLSTDKWWMLFKFLEYGLADFVDWQTGECGYDSQDFKDILAFCNDRGGTEKDWGEEEDLSSLIYSGKVLLMDGYGSMENIRLFKKIFGEDVTYIGYPSKDRQGSYFLFSNRMGIYSGSDVKDGAWAFIRTFMTKEYQGKYINSEDFPTRKDCFELLLKQKMTTETYTDEFGQEISPLSGSLGMDNVEVELEPLTQEETETYIRLIQETKKVSHIDWQMLNIIQEEAKPYFAGDRELDRTAEIIQNRVQTYVNEAR